jgi:hypothetical protein
MITHTFDLDVVPGSVPVVVHVSQYDDDVRIIFNLYASTGVLNIEQNSTVAIRGTKPDGNGISVECVLDGSAVTVDLTQQMTAVAGYAIFELTLYQNDHEMNTANFILDVERAAFDKDTLGSDSVIRELVSVIDRTDEIIAAAQQSDNAKEQIALIGAAVAASEAKAKQYAETAQQASEDTTATKTAAEESIAEKLAAALEQIQHKQDAILEVTTNADELAAQALQNSSNTMNEVDAFASRMDDFERIAESLSLRADTFCDELEVDDNGMVWILNNGMRIAGPYGPFAGSGGGGGGSSGNAATLTVSNETGWLSKTIADGDSCVLTINWESIEDTMPTGNGSLRITSGGTVRAVLDVAQGLITLDLSPYLSVGANAVRLTISDVYDNNRTITFNVTVVSISISSTFDPSTPYTGPIIFPYTPVGSVKKTVYFILDGEELGSTQTSVSGRQQTYVIPQQSHGVHTFQVYFEADINGQVVRSNELYFEIIALEALNETPIISSSFNTSEVTQYTAIPFTYTVYSPASMMSDIKLYLNGSLIAEQTVDRTQQIYTYRATEVGTVTFKVECGSVSRTFTVTITESEIDVEAEEDSLVLYLTSSGRSNAETTKDVWKYGSIKAQLTGFNYTSDGWQRDSEGTTVLRVAGDARVTIPYQIFAEDFRSKGKTIEIEFATKMVMDYDAVILSCLSGGRGLYMTAQKVQMNSEQSEISMQFKEDEHVRVAFVVEKRSENRLIYCYFNGIMSGTVQYPSDDDFSQTEPVDISIGSNDCTIDIYCIRVYDNDLTRHQILTNWIADTQVVEDMLDRYKRNQVYDDYGSIVIANLPSDLPYLVLEAAELPQYKGDKKTVSGRFVDPVTPSRNFTFTDAIFNVQGTSSQYYERKNYKGSYKNGFLMASGQTADTYALRDDSIAVATFCYKADVASSEGANNVELVRLYDMACPYKTPAQQEDSRVQQGIDGFPIVIFWTNTDTGETTFIGKYNFNNDKSTEETFGFQEDDESWEVKNNTGDRVLYKSANYEGTDWLNDFEARFPDTDPAYEDPGQLKAFADWIITTDTEAATNEELANPVTYGGVEYATDSAAYRIAKFKAELGDYVELQSAEFYYLFTELFLMVDSRAKNMFPSFMGTAISSGEEDT